MKAFFLFCLSMVEFYPSFAAARPQPEAASLRLATPRSSYSKKSMVVAANRLATEVGDNILSKGGHAVDAAVAVQLVLNLVEPQSSGIGGGAFAVLHSAKNKETTSWDARETAPLSTGPLHFHSQGAALKFAEAKLGGLAVGTPGMLRLLVTLHGKYGKLPWAQLVEPALQLAKTGFKVSQRMAASLAREKEKLLPSARDLYSLSGRLLREGDLFRNLSFARTLQEISKDKDKSFYSGSLAKKIVERVRSNEGRKGLLQLQDLQKYQIKKRDPVCMDWRDYRVCGMGPPSSGATTVGQILKLQENHSTKKRSEMQELQHNARIHRLVYADRAKWLGDGDFVPIPVKGLLNDRYLKSRAKWLLTPREVFPGAGDPPSSIPMKKAFEVEKDSTTHFVIVDTEGNGISMTSSIESAFGARIAVGGFLLNNQLTDFSFHPKNEHGLVANRVQGGKRPRSSMSPTVVLDKNQRIKLLVGSAGGSRIPVYVASVIYRTLAQGMTLPDALNTPHMVSRGPVMELEDHPKHQGMQSSFKKMKQKFSIKDMNSGTHAVMRQGDRWQGVADPRREGWPSGFQSR